MFQVIWSLKLTSHFLFFLFFLVLQSMSQTTNSIRGEKKQRKKKYDVSTAYKNDIKFTYSGNEIQDIKNYIAGRGYPATVTTKANKNKFRSMVKRLDPMEVDGALYSKRTKRTDENGRITGKTEKTVLVSEFKVLVICNDDLDRIWLETHVDCAHPGIGRTIDLVKNKYYVKQLTQWVKYKAGKCSCSNRKKKKKK